MHSLRLISLWIHLAFSFPQTHTFSTKRAIPRTSPPSGAITVDNSPNRSVSSFTTVQAGVNALSNTTTTPQYLFIYPGTYTEQVFIRALQSNLTVQGYTTDASSYHQNEVDITFNLAALDIPSLSDDLTATVRQWNPNTKFYNLNIHNTFGHVPVNGQNLALSAHTSNQGYYGVQLLSYQDTLLANIGTQLFSNSLITGAVDFIFGHTAQAWFENIDIRTIAAGCITANGRDSASNPSWFVVNRSTVASINSSVAVGSAFLGRPWEVFARVVFQNTHLSDVITPAGWSIWHVGEPNTQNVTFAEFNNSGPGSIGAEGPRANFSEQFGAPVAIETVLGNGFRDEWWVDLDYL